MERKMKFLVCMPLYVVSHLIFSYFNAHDYICLNCEKFRKLPFCLASKKVKKKESDVFVLCAHVV